MEGKYFVSVELINLKQKLANVLNVSPLPYCLKQVAMQEVLNAVQEAAQQEYQHDLVEAEKAKEEKNKEPAKEG